MTDNSEIKYPYQSQCERRLVAASIFRVDFYQRWVVK
jgi:hypothetical protein